MSLIGIMQGRLSPPISGRIQAFPVNAWRGEFSLARKAGLDCIEWIYDVDTEVVNPLRTDVGVDEVRRAIEHSSVSVWSVCADYYMTERLIAPDGTPREAVVQHLKWLIERASLLGVRYIVLPFVDISSLQSSEELKGLLKAMQSVMTTIESAGVELHLETDLHSVDLVAVLEALNHPLIRANYDTGNSASLGHDPAEELMLLKPWLGSVHIKDRILGGGTVPLGTGATDFSTCFHMIFAAHFRGPLILQAAREEIMDEVTLGKHNRQFVEKKLVAAGRQMQ